MNINWFLIWYPQMLVLMVLSLVAVVMSHTWSSCEPERNTCGCLRAGKPADSVYQGIIMAWTLVCDRPMMFQSRSSLVVLVP